MAAFEVFVSYSRHDEPIVVPVVKLLRLGDHGMVFLDLDSIPPGELWRGRLEQALASARYVVLFWCEHACGSREVEREYRAALATGKTLVPVLLDKTPLPPGLSEHQWIDFSALATGTHRPHPTPPPPAPAPAPALLVTVLSHDGAALAQPLKAQFDELGGNIGRADRNQLVLPDPGHTISRVHAQVVCRSGAYTIVARGTNPVTVDARTLGQGDEAPLHGGERLRIGAYLMQVELAAPADTGAAVDPLETFGSAAPAGSPIAPGAIPDDWDPFAVDPAAPSEAPDLARPPGPAVPQPLDIDPLFGLSPPRVRPAAAAPSPSAEAMAAQLRDELLRRAGRDGVM